jgi:hypothetical protein
MPILTKKIWLAYYTNNLDNTLIEGSESKVRKFVRDNYKNDFKAGKIRIGYTFI